VRARQYDQMLETAIAALGRNVGAPAHIADRHIGIGAFSQQFAQVDRFDVIDPQCLTIFRVGQNMLHIGNQRKRHAIRAWPIG